MKLWARCTCLYLRRSEGCPLTRGTGDAPPISFSVAPKRKRAVHGHLRAKSRRCASVALRNTSLRLGERKRRLGAKRHGVPYLLMIRGPQQETLGGRIGVSVGRGPSSSQSPYPSLSAYAESSLIPTLVLSPRKPLRWVFAGAPDLLKLSVLRPRRSASVRRGCKPDLTCFFSPLPLCRPRGGLGHFIDLARSVLVKYYNFQSM